MKKLALFVTAAALCGSAVFATDIADILKTKKELRFNADGTFRVLVLGDVQSSAVPLQESVQANIRTLVDREKPDLVLFPGDNSIRMNSEEKLRTYLKSMVGYIEQKQIPWAHAYGNHDHEGALSKEAQEVVYESFDWCVTERGPKDIAGVGNCVLPVYGSKSNKPVFCVWGIDSGTYISGNFQKQIAPKVSPFKGSGSTGYDYIRPNQIAWYVDTSKKLEQYVGNKVPGLMFFHIALQESFFAWENREGLEYTGEKREGVCSSIVNSGMFATVLERGDVKAIVNGHDHINDYMVKYAGVILAFCSTPSTASYHKVDMLGGRVFVINEKSPAEIETYMSYINKRTDTVENLKEVKSDVLEDFEGEQPKINVTNFDGEGIDPNAVKLSTVNGKGVNGSKALAVTRTTHSDSAWRNNFELHVSLGDKAGMIGNAKYIKVYMDFTGQTSQIDFRKACVGFFNNSAMVRAFRTDDNDGSNNLKFYYKADGSSNWVAKTHGGDGCFGAAEGASVKGLKGWFAFPIADMYSGATKPNESTPIYGVYFYFCLSNASMANNAFYIDNISFVKEL